MVDDDTDTDDSISFNVSVKEEVVDDDPDTDDSIDIKLDELVDSGKL